MKVAYLLKNTFILLFAGRVDKDDPEPKIHPTMDRPPMDSRINSKQIINNQFTNQLSNRLVNSVPTCRPFNVWQSQNLPIQIQPQQTYTLVPTAFAYQQLLPLANTFRNASLPISYNAPQPNQNQRIAMGITRKAWYRRNKYLRDLNAQNQTSQDNFNEKIDLRKKLVRRKSFSGTLNENHQELSTGNSKNNWNESEWEETSIQMNLTPLKLLTSSDSNKWYIVVDTDVILNNYNYLNNMTAADPDFYLVIPHHVMSELRLHVSESNNVQARRILRFLTEQIESGLATLGDEVPGERASNKAIMTCVKLASQDNNVILISNNGEMLKYKSNIKYIHIFTMQNVKDILLNRPTRLPRPNSPTLSVKITVPNNVVRNSVETCDDSTETTCEGNFESTEVADFSGDEKALGVQTQNHFKVDCSQNLPNLDVNEDKELADSGVDTMSVWREHSPEKSKTDFNQNKQAAISGYEFPDTGVDHSALSPFESITEGYFSRTSIPKKSVDASPSKLTDHSSLSSSSGHVSIDTINMKRIISMKRLPSTELQKAKSIESTISKTSTKSTEIPQTEKITTTEINSRLSNDNISEAREMSTSRITNTGSSHLKLDSPFKNDAKKLTLRSVVMFEVACQSMEDVLKTRCDEWVFRFVHIMEEVLRVKLQEKVRFENKEYPAPRDLQEAARCIIKKYSNNYSVVDAANKLSFILYKTSDENGKIAVNIQPSDYMEMYSYGVFLVDTFQDMIADCKEKDCKKNRTDKPKEDKADSCSCYEVNAASESLKKLLFDIQNANLDTFVDHPRDATTKNPCDQFDYELDATEEMANPETTELPYGEQALVQYEDHINDLYYNLRPRKRKSQSTEENEVSPKVTITGKVIEPTFFNSLQLQKSLNTKEPEGHIDVKDKNADKQNSHTNKEQCHTTEQVQPTDDPRKEIHDLKIHFSKNDFTNAKSQSKVVCHFTVNPDIERKVKERQNEMEYEDYIENVENVVDAMPLVKGSIICENNNGESKFKCFMGRLVRRLGDIFTQVKLLCDKYVKEVKSNKQPDVSAGNEFLCKVEMACSIIGIIHHSLDSISKRDVTDNDKNIQMLLKIAKVGDYIPDDKLCLEYRHMINKCKETAEEFHNKVQNILKIIGG